MKSEWSLLASQLTEFNSDPDKGSLYSQIFVLQYSLHLSRFLCGFLRQFCRQFCEFLNSMHIIRPTHSIFPDLGNLTRNSILKERNNYWR